MPLHHKKKKKKKKIWMPPLPIYSRVKHDLTFFGMPAHHAMHGHMKKTMTTNLNLNELTSGDRESLKSPTNFRICLFVCLFFV